MSQDEIIRLITYTILYYKLHYPLKQQILFIPCLDDENNNSTLHIKIYTRHKI